jgi:hypothetical protein
MVCTNFNGVVSDLTPAAIRDTAAINIKKDFFIPSPQDFMDELLPTLFRSAAARRNLNSTMESEFACLMGPARIVQTSFFGLKGRLIFV